MSAPDLPLEILWPRLIAIADEMATTLVRTAFTHDVIEVHDMSTGLYDDRGFLIAQSWLAALGHVGVMPVFGKSLLQAVPPATIRPGDIFICNDPWLANGQTADVFITMPAFIGQRLIGFSINSVHHVDIGGRKGSGLSEEVFEEGLIIPHLRLYRAGRPNEDLFALLRRNVRFSEKMIGDIRAQIATCHVGVTQLESMARDYKLEWLRPLTDEITRRSEAGFRRARRAARRLLLRGDAGRGGPDRARAQDRPRGHDRGRPAESGFHRHVGAGAPPGQLAAQLYPRLCHRPDQAGLRSPSAEQRRDLSADQDQRPGRLPGQSFLPSGDLLAPERRPAGRGADVPNLRPDRACASAGRFRRGAHLAVLCERRPA